ncbi:hypothetical protein [Streptomyces yanii]
MDTSAIASLKRSRLDKQHRLQQYTDYGRLPTATSGVFTFFPTRSAR